MTFGPFTPKPKPCANPLCKNMFIPSRPLQAVCGPVCAGRLVKARKAAEKVALKARKEAIKRPTEWLNECKLIVQKIARLRDRDDACISCHMGPNYGGRWHGSHYMPAGNNAAIELNLLNVNKACAQCNLFKSGNRGPYRVKLVEKIGLERVEWLERQNHAHKHSLDYLKRFKAVMGKRLRRLEKRIEN